MQTKKEILKKYVGKGGPTSIRTPNMAGKVVPIGTPGSVQNDGGKAYMPGPNLPAPAPISAPIPQPFPKPQPVDPGFGRPRPPQPIYPNPPKRPMPPISFPPKVGLPKPPGYPKIPPIRGPYIPPRFPVGPKPQPPAYTGPHLQNPDWKPPVYKGPGDPNIDMNNPINKPPSKEDLVKKYGPKIGIIKDQIGKVRPKIDYSGAPEGTPPPTDPLPGGAIGWFWYGGKWNPNYQYYPS